LIYARGDLGFAAKDSIGDVLISKNQLVVKTIPGSFDSEEYGVRIWLIISDGANIDTLNVSRRVIATKTEDVVIPSEAWIPIAASALLGDNSIAGTLKDLSGGTKEDWNYNNKNFRIFRWFANGSAPYDWLEYSAEQESLFAFLPGRLFWAKARYESVFNFGSGTTPSLAAPVSIDAAPGQWTDVGVPFRFNVLLSDVLRATGPGSDSLFFAKWNKTTKTFEYIYSRNIPGMSVADDTLSHELLNVAYSVYNATAHTIAVKIPPTPPVLSNASLSKMSHASGWDLPLSITSAHYGALPVMHIGWAPGKGAELLPVRGGFAPVSAVIVGRDNTLNAHYISHADNAPGAEALIRISNNSTQNEMFELNMASSSEKDFRIFSPENKQFEDVNGKSIISLKPGEQAFRIAVVGAQSYVSRFKNGFVNVSCKVSSVWPNPFKNGLTIRYMLPYKSYESLTFELFNLSGRLVWKKAVSKENLIPGVQNFSWSGIDSHGKSLVSGTYILRMNATEYGKKPTLSEIRLTKIQ
jgi:hypothetical protein